MKKFLSLVLALVMTMSLVTVSAGAKDFTDNSSITYKEAVDVMSAVGVIDGYVDGDFRPTATLTRGAAAKIICNLILGPTTALALSADAAPYSDVPADSTFAGYIAYCQKEGIISGYADGTFRPGNSLTGYAFMKMLLGVLGYDVETEGYTGANWSIAVAKRALNIGLDDGLTDDFNGVKAVTREEACLYALNTLKATMVEYENSSSVTVNGVTFTNKSVAKEVETANDKGTIKKDGYVQFAEKYFTNLKKYSVTNDFAQPATKWTLKAEKIGTYVDTADLTYSGKVELGDIYADLGMSTKDAAEYYIDGSDKTVVSVEKGSDVEVGVGNGATTYVYFNDDTNDVTICTINVYVGSVTKSVEATKSQDAYIVVASEDAEPKNFTGKFETDEEFEDDAVVLYTFSVSAKEIKSVKVAEKVAGELTKIVNTKSYTLDDTVYKFSVKISYESGLTAANMTKKSDYTFYLDNDNNVIFVEEEEYVSDDYALVLAIEGDDVSDFTDARVKLLKADGTVKTYDTEKNYTSTIAKGDIVTWSYDETDDEVTLKEVNAGTAETDKYAVSDTKTAFVLTNSKAAVDLDGTNTIYANSKTVFVVKNSDGDYDVYTGIKNVPTIKANGKNLTVAYYCKTSAMATVMFIDASVDGVTIESSSSKAIFLAGESRSKQITDKATKIDYYEYNAVVDGEATTVKVSTTADMSKGQKILTGVEDSTAYNYLFGGATYNADGIITAFSANSDAQSPATKTDKLSGEYNVKLGGKSYVVAEDANIWMVNEDGEITAASVKSVKKDDNNTVLFTMKDGEVTNLFVQEVDDDVVVDEDDETEYHLIYWTASNKGALCIAFEDQEDGSFLSRREIVALGLDAADFTLTVDGLKYTGLETVEYGTSTTLGGSSTGGYIKVSFGGVGEVFASGDYYNAAGKTDSITSIKLELDGMNVTGCDGVVAVD